MAAHFEAMSANQLLELAVGSVLAFLGLATITFAATAGRGRRAAAAWFGVFTLLYAIRLLAIVVPVEQFFGVSARAASFVDAGITYLILVPAVGATAQILEWRGHLLRRLWQADLVYGVIALSIDLARFRPGSMRRLNAPAVTLNFTILLVAIASTLRGARRTTGLLAALAGLAVFVVTAAYETYLGAAGIVAPFKFEPLGMLVFVAGLGYLIAERLIAADRQMLVMSQEMETARRIQRSILPDGVPEVARLAVEARLLPMRAVAGDFFDFVRTPDGALGVLVADVSGHGVPAAIIASMVKIAFASEAEHARDPGLLLSRVNQTLCGKFDLAYVTAVYACVDPSSRVLVYASAGHPAPLLRRASGEVLKLERRDLVLGFKPGVRYAAGRVSLDPGDFVLLYTDGIAEVEGPAGEFFGDRRLEQWIGSQDVRTSPRQIVEGLLNEINAWKSPPGGEFADDVTAIVLRFGDIAAAGSAGSRT